MDLHDLHINEWLELILRWSHVFAGIMWVGATYYFTWLDGRFVDLEKEGEKNPNADKYVWMVHSGGFYQVEKQKRPNQMPPTLHWFRWEAAITWLTGFVLFLFMYYHGGLLIRLEDSPLSKGATIGLSLGMIVVGWVAYDLIWKFIKNELVGATICFGLIVLSAWVSVHFFTERAAYIQVGAMMGTIMAANVWMGILPAQRRMVAALKEGREPDLKEGASAKARSKHNSFIVIPVVVLMISNHYPFTYGSPYNWEILSALVLVGWGAAKIIRRA